MKAEASPLRVLLLTVSLCAVCAGLVSSAVVLLRPRQALQQELAKKTHILLTAGLVDKDSSPTEIEAIYQAAVRSFPLPDLEANRPPRTIFHIYQKDTLKLVVLPIEGKGLWSTLYGFLAIKTDGSTVQGLRFYQHGETPGLGGEVDNPRWLALWSGKQIFDAQGRYRLRVLKGRIDSLRPDSLRHEVDGLSGATLTSRGIDSFLAYWLGPKEYGPYLRQLARSQGARDE